MIAIGNYEISFNLNPLFLILGVIVLALYTYFVYMVTIPVISSKLKVLLILLRILSVGLIFILIFEPLIRETEIELIEPTTYVFIDNSASMVQQDSNKVTQDIAEIMSDVKSSVTGNIKYFSFGANAGEIIYESIPDLSLNEKFTNLANVAEIVNQSNDNLTNILLITDGIINTGANPINELEVKSIPITVIAFGDSTENMDVSVKDIILNSYLYKGKETTIEAILLNSGFANRKVEVKLLENNSMISSRVVDLSSSGINRILFQYTPETSGEKKLQVQVSQLTSEKNIVNNSKIVFRNVSENKLRVGIISDSPSFDLSFIKNSLKLDDENEIIEYITVDGRKLISKSRLLKSLDSIDIFYLINFPTINSQSDIVQRVFSKINEDNTPFFLQVSGLTDISKLSGIKEVLPVTFSETNLNFVKAQLDVVDKLSSLLIINSKFDADIWNNLPPLFALSTGAISKPEAKIIANVKIKNVPTRQPLIVSKTESNKRSLVLLGEEFWRWKLNVNNSDNIFDQFMDNITAWLKADPEKQRFRVTLDKKVFTFGETINITTELYDEKLSPVDDAEISVSFSSEEQDSEIYLINKGNGIYSSTWNANLVGDLSYTAKAKKNDITLGIDSGIITVDESDIERSQKQMNKQLLREIALVTSGKYIDNFEVEPATRFINNLNEGAVKENRIMKEYRIWSNEYSLILIILFFGIEWFLRKRNGMI